MASPSGWPSCTSSPADGPARRSRHLPAGPPHQHERPHAVSNPNNAIRLAGAHGRFLGSLVIRGGRVIDPAQGIDAITDIAIRDGFVEAVGVGADAPPGAQVIDARGLIVTPGFVDLHTHLREPGFEYRETIATGTAAAAAGGFT
ncbi:MAG: hypothetical protein EB140_13785, partial [Proteobacteria bacterium]|nr:hypothetical protein [Pseudomonadota bacterium]